MGIGKKGFTLVEIIVSLAIMTIVAGAVGAFVIAGNNSYMRGNKELTLQEEAQLTANQMINLIIDVEKGISFSNLTDQEAVDINGDVAKDVNGLDVTNASVSELRLINNDNSYMIRWQGGAGADYADANQVYLYEVTNTKDGEGKLVVGDFDTAKPALMAEHVSSFSVDLSELDKRKVVLNMTFTYQDKSYDISETIKLRNDLSSEPSSIYSWISGIRIIPDHADLKQGQAFVFNYEITGDDEAKAQGVTWNVTYQDGSACKSTISGNGKLSVADDENFGDNILKVTCTSVADPTMAATATVTVKAQLIDSLVISPKEANVMQGYTQEFTYTMTGKEDAVKQGVTWELEKTEDAKIAGLAVGTDINKTGNPGILKVGRYEELGVRVLRVTCRSVADPSVSSSALVTVLPYSSVDGKYNTRLIATKLTTYQYDAESGEKKWGYKANIECLPGWADYTHGYPIIKWSETTNPSAYEIGHEAGYDEQYTCTLYGKEQRNTTAHVQAIVQLSATETVIVGIDIWIPDLMVTYNPNAPYIDSDQFVLNRNGVIHCELKNYDDYKGEITWKFEDTLGLGSDKEGGDDKRLVGFDIEPGVGGNDNWDGDDDHNTPNITKEHVGTDKKTDVRAKWYVDWNKEYRLKLLACNESGDVVAETYIVIPKFDILFTNGEHYMDIKRNVYYEQYPLTVYGFAIGQRENNAFGGGNFRLQLNARIEADKPLGSDNGNPTEVKFISFGKLNNQPELGEKDWVAIAVNWKEPNDIIMLRIWDERRPDADRILTFVVK